MAALLVLIQAILFDSALPFKDMSAWADQSSGTIVFACLMDGKLLKTAQDVESKGSIDTWLAGQFATPLPQSNPLTFLCDAPSYPVWSFEVCNQI